MPVITCSNGIKCHISFKNKDNELITVLDFKIKSYKVFNYGWHQYDYPSNIILEDKLYLNEEKLNKIINSFDNFINYGYLTEEDVKDIEDFKDLKGNKIRLYNSSSVDAKLWFGCNINEAYIKVGETIEPFSHIKGEGVFGDGLLINDRLHLTESQVKRLLKTFKKAKLNHQVEILENVLQPKNSTKKLKV